VRLKSTLQKKDSSKPEKTHEIKKRDLAQSKFKARKRKQKSHKKSQKKRKMRPEC